MKQSQSLSLVLLASISFLRHKWKKNLFEKKYFEKNILNIAPLKMSWKYIFLSEIL